MTRKMLWAIWVVLTVAAVAVLLAGCTGVVSSPEPAPDPTIYGTWKIVSDDDEDGQAHHYLTFTKSRWVQTKVVYDENGKASREYDQYWSGGVIITDDTVTKQLDRNDPVDKAYTIEGQDGLRIHHWGPPEPVSTFERWERVHDPIAGGLEGRWQAAGQFDYEPDEGGTQTVTWQMNIALGERFEYRNQSTVLQAGNEDHYDTTLIGEWQLDPDEQFIYADITNATSLLNGETRTEVDLSIFEGHRLRFGFAAVPLPNTIAVSSYGFEQDYNPETGAWEADTEIPFGQYSSWATRQ